MANDKQRDRKHFFFRDHGKRRAFTSPRSGGGGSDVPPRDREEHALLLERALTQAIQAAERQISTRDEAMECGQRGFYLEFDFPFEQRSVLDNLENFQGADHIELVSVRPSETNPDEKIAATVFVPESKKDVYLRKVEQYRTEETSGGKPRHQPLVASIDTVRPVTQARSLFTDDPDLFPAAGEDAWWEVWLRDGGRETLQHSAERFKIEVRDHSIRFAEREVALVRATPVALGLVLANSNIMAELRLAQDTPNVFMDMTERDQRDRAFDLVDRIKPPQDDAPAVCVLDSGSTRQHPLISIALDAADQQTWNSNWTVVEDVGLRWHGHGTQMSGLALYGDLAPRLTDDDEFTLTHRLESVKILPDHGQSDPDLYGHITVSAVGVAEVQAPDRKRAFCLAVTSSEMECRGRPTSWSAKIDDLAYGDGEDQRLFVVSAGNVAANYSANEYLKQNDASPIENPAQAWNALTVGAITEKCTITDPTFADWRPLAAVGDLSPKSRTSLTWQDDWPVKPDIVMEGGNYGVEPATGRCDQIDDLWLLTTHHRINERLFTVIGDTSAATALAARMAAQIHADNAELRPETVRALIVHSAEWTHAMCDHLPVNSKTADQQSLFPPQPGARVLPVNLKTPDKQLLLRRYGYGVPDLGRALRSLNSDVTLVFEGMLQPFIMEGGTVKTRDMALHEMPWPRKTLEGLRDADVEMRVTLGYFIEPNPGERGWTKRHAYSSHGLRFDVKRAEENDDQFMRRINKAAQEADEGAVAGGGSDHGWVIGPSMRARGSIHSDIWKGAAADLASRHGVAVYPVGGWWREKKSLERTDREARYALIVTVRAQVDVDLYAEIAVESRVEATVEVPDGGAPTPPYESPHET